MASQFVKDVRELFLDTGVGVDAYVELLDEVDHPNLRAMFDPWAPALHGDDLFQAARRLAPRMVQTTLADYVRLEAPSYLHLAYRPGVPLVRDVMKAGHHTFEKVETRS